jgi:hypothetical protein
VVVPHIVAAAEQHIVAEGAGRTVAVEEEAHSVVAAAGMKALMTLAVE